MKRNAKRLTESYIRSIVDEAVKRCINEISDETVARAAGKSHELNDPYYSKKSSELGNEPQFKGKSDDYISRKRRQARYFDQEMERRAKDFRSQAGYGDQERYDAYKSGGGESVPSYDYRMNQQYNQGRSQGEKQRYQMYKR